MTAILQMGWPFATVCIAFIIGCVVAYGIRTASLESENARKTDVGRGGAG